MPRPCPSFGTARGSPGEVPVGAIPERGMNLNEEILPYSWWTSSQIPMQMMFTKGICVNSRFSPSPAGAIQFRSAAGSGMQRMAESAHLPMPGEASAYLDMFQD